MNAIRHNRIGCVHQEDGSIDIVIPASMAEEFIAMVKRGTNTSPNMHVEIRDFVDRLLKQEDIMNNSCMKSSIYGYPRYPEKNIVTTHWDIPSEDKFELASDNSLITPPNFVGNE